MAVLVRRPRRGRRSTGQSRIVIQCLWFGEEENGRLEEERRRGGVIHWHRGEKNGWQIFPSRTQAKPKKQNEISRNHVPTTILLSLPCRWEGRNTKYKMFLLSPDSFTTSQTTSKLFLQMSRAPNTVTQSKRPHRFTVSHHEIRRSRCLPSFPFPSRGAISIGPHDRRRAPTRRPRRRPRSPTP